MRDVDIRRESDGNILWMVDAEYAEMIWGILEEGLRVGKWMYKTGASGNRRGRSK